VIELYLIIPDELGLLERLKPVAESERKGDSACLHGTREELLGGIVDWADRLHDGSSQQVLWLRGVAGLGKSTISHSASQELAAANRLGASCFFSRDVTERTSSSNRFATIAYHFAYMMASHRNHLCAVLKRFHVPPDAARQLHELLVTPLRQSTPPPQPLVVLLDALDECDDVNDVNSFLAR
jgi:hypothetical protein